MSSSERFAVVTASLSFFISTLDTGIVNVALPTLSHALNVNAAIASWTVSAYAAALSITILPFGRLADRIGMIRLSTVGFILFALFSIGCAVSGGIRELIVFRALTGVAAAMLQATAASFVTRYVEPANRGRAFGWVSAILSSGVVLGPSLGGLIISIAAWQWIFLAAVPFGIAGCAAGLVLRKIRSREPVSNGGVHRQSLTGLARLAPFLAAAALGATFIAVFVGTPFELTREAHLASWQIGLVLLTTPLGAAIAGRLAGGAVQRGLSTPAIVFGLVLDGAAAIALFYTPAHAVALFAALLFLFGVGSGALQTPTIALSLAAYPAKAQSTAGAMQRFIQNIAIAGGAALCGFFVDRFGSGSVWMFAAAVAFGASGAVPLLLRSVTASAE